MCASTRRSCSASPTRRGGNRAAGRRATTDRSTTPCGSCGNAGYDVTVQPFDFEYTEDLASLTQDSPTPTDYGPDVNASAFTPVDVNGAGDGRDRPGRPRASRRHRRRARRAAARPPTSPASRPTASPWSSGDRATSSSRSPTPRPQEPPASSSSTRASPAVTARSAASATRRVSTSRWCSCPSPSVRTSTPPSLAGPVTVTVDDFQIAETRIVENVLAETQSGNDDERRDGRRPPRLGPGGSRHQRQRLRHRGPARGGREHARGQPAQHGALRPVGRRGVGPARARSTTSPTSPRRRPNDIKLYLNFDMIGSPNFFRGIYDGDGDAFGIPGPPGSEDIEDTFEEFYDAERSGLPGHRVQRTFRLRPVHRRRHPVRRAVHRRRGHQDRRRGRAVRRHGRRRLRPVLPPGVRHVRQRRTSTCSTSELRRRRHRHHQVRPQHADARCRRRQPHGRRTPGWPRSSSENVNHNLPADLAAA